MERIYRESGKKFDCVAPVGGVKVGDFMIIGLVFGVAAIDALEGENYPLDVGGVWQFPKASGNTFSQGAAVYYDSTNKNFTSTSSGNTKVGVAHVAAISGDALVEVRLNSNF